MIRKGFFSENQQHLFCLIQVQAHWAITNSHTNPSSVSSQQKSLSETQPHLFTEKTGLILENGKQDRGVEVFLSEIQRCNISSTDFITF